eukprot:c15781_g1_i1 orf=439-2010(-)
MMSIDSFLNNELSEKTPIFGLKLWIVTGVAVVVFIVLILIFLSIWLTTRRKSRGIQEKLPSIMIPTVSKEIKEVKVDRTGSKDPRLQNSTEGDKAVAEHVVYGVSSGPKSGNGRANLEVTKRRFKLEESGVENGRHSPPREEGKAEMTNRLSSPVHNAILEGEKLRLLASTITDDTSNASGECRGVDSSSPNLFPPTEVPEVSQLGWGQWYTLRELQVATNYFSKSNVLGEGGYAIVYRGQLTDGTLVAVKNLLNNGGQAEREFRVEVEAIGRVRHKNLVRLLGYCADGSQRMLVYEYVDNGNLDQWVHGALGEQKPIPWDVRMKIILTIAKGLAYLHEGLEPKVVHRDVKSSNILLDRDWNAKVSDFGLAKLLGSEKSHVTTRVMGTFGYVAPEYASTGLLNERSDVYSFGVLMMELITGREPVDYGRPAGEVNLVDWLKMMVGCRRSEEVADPKMEIKPSSRALKRALLVALRCVDPDSEKRPKMGQVIHMLEADDSPFRDDRKVAREANRAKNSSPHHVI